TSRPPSPRASSAPTTSAPAAWCGTGTPATPSGPRRWGRARPIPGTRPTAGRCSAPTRISAWSTSPWATSRPTSGAAAATRRLRWAFQTVHHDLWDMDVPAQPSLIDLDLADGRVPALVAPTKQGDLYVLDRRDGTPIVPVEEVAAPRGAAPGDATSPTQP